MRVIKDHRGSIAVLAALFLPIAILILAVMVDAGIVMARRAKLSAVAEFAAQAGSAEIADLIVGKAQARNPPADATDPLIYLTDDDRVAIASDVRVSAAVQDYIERNRLLNQPPPSVIVEYPANAINCAGSADQKRIDLKVMAQESFPTIFPNLFLNQSQATVKATAIQSVQICPS